MKFRLVFFSLFIFSTALFSQNLDQLNGYQYVYVPTLIYTHNKYVTETKTVRDGNGNVQYNKENVTETPETYTTEDDYHISEEVKQFFLNMGYTVLTSMDAFKGDKCLVLFCGLKHDWNYAKAIVTITLTNCKQELIYSKIGIGKHGLFSTYQASSDKSTVAALEDLAKLNYKYNHALTPSNGNSAEVRAINTNSDSAKTSSVQSITDARDGKKYRIIKFGTQTWMAENLAFKASAGCWAYNNDSINVTKLGYLYDWEAAKTACPDGWHLPTDAEWATLTDNVGGTGDAGTVLTISNGFHAVFAGYSADDGKSFYHFDKFGFFWTATDATYTFAWYRYFSSGDASIYRGTPGNEYKKVNGFSVRCVKD